MDSCVSNLSLSIPIWLRYNCSSALAYSAICTIIPLPSIIIPSMITISSLNGQYGFRSFCTSAFVKGQPCSMSSDSMPGCSSSSVAILISSSIIQFHVSVHDSIAFMVMHMPGISSSLFQGCVRITNLWWIIVVLVCIVFLCCINGFTIEFFWAHVIGFQHLSWILLPVACGPQLHWLHGWSSSDDNFLGHWVYPALCFSFYAAIADFHAC